MLRTATMTAIVLAVATTAYAQQQTDPQLKQEAEAIYSKWEKAINAYDADALREISTPDDFTISVNGVESRDKVTESMERNRGNNIHLTGTVKDVQQLGQDAALSRGSYEVTTKQGSAQGNWLQVLVKESSDWKVRATAYSRTPPQPATASEGREQQPTSGSSTPEK